MKILQSIYTFVTVSILLTGLFTMLVLHLVNCKKGFKIIDGVAP